MSYINEALRRAQREKDAGNYKKRGILSKTGRKSFFMSGRWIWVGPAFLIFLAFALYSWLDFRCERSQPVSKIKESPVAPSKESITSAHDCYEKARFFHKNGRLSDARVYYQKALMLDPEHAPALNNIGVIYIQEGNYSAGKKSLENAVRLKPAYADPYYNLACLYALKGQEMEGLENLKKAAFLDKSVKEWAKKDKDLGKIRELPGFKEIIGDGEVAMPGHSSEK